MFSRKQRVFTLFFALAIAISLSTFVAAETADGQLVDGSADTEVQSREYEFCCSPHTMKLEWRGIIVLSMHENGICTRHCFHEVYWCRTCGAHWGDRHTIISPNGCRIPAAECRTQANGWCSAPAY